MTGPADPGVGGPAVLFAGDAGHSFWLPPPVSTYATEVDDLFTVLLWMSAALFALLVVCLLVFVWRYGRQRGEFRPVRSVGRGTQLWLARLGVPVAALAAMLVPFYLGASVFMDMRVPPRSSLDVRVVGQKWSWRFTYPNGVEATELHVPVDRPVRLLMRSEDVVHSLFVPALRVKMDVLPDRDTTAWFQAAQTGAYQLLCAEYCGSGHWQMGSTVVVHPEVEFGRWLAKAASTMFGGTPIELGARLHETKGCTQCHSVDGTSRVGPTFKGSFGSTRSFVEGPPTAVNDAYIRESILQPQEKLAEGFPPVMPSFAGKLDDTEINGLIEYIRSLAGDQRR